MPHLDSNQLETLLETLRSGNHIEAIKLYREWTGSNLAQAKLAVEEMQRKFESGMSAEEILQSAEADSSNTDSDDAQRQAVLEEIRKGRKLQAIKIYRDYSGAGLKDAKEFIEQLTEQLKKEDPSFVPKGNAGCGAAVLLLAASVCGCIWGISLIV
ncbi:50S ribosomal protein L7/L12 [Thalassoglobus neptunius]|uniref:50S ribosomal protein L7/L12 n=1 Tax=Thalassoglobus neptunius TaxID=1938619 RepID=A0A5C5WZ11_9PLAN|nr:ribosomal protein L7/L12 [Thalassoglobus neptunius]TWT55848.1 50S ribosomal protein L7/L12 [Thalassoglobus neptunius]